MHNFLQNPIFTQQDQMSIDAIGSALRFSKKLCFNCYFSYAIISDNIYLGKMAAIISDGFFQIICDCQQQSKAARRA